MRVIVHASDEGIGESLRIAAALADYQADIEPSTQNLCSMLYREPDAMGVIWSSTLVKALAVTREFRAAGVRNLLFVLLHMGQVTPEAMIEVLGAGADDVQPAPIDSREYIARLRALVARCRRNPDPSVHLPGENVFNPVTGTIVSPSMTVVLTMKEAEIFAALTERPETICTKEMLMDRLYGGRDEPDMKIVDVFVCKLRRKLSRALGETDVIQTVWGRGYQFIQQGFVPVLSESRRRMAG